MKLTGINKIKTFGQSMLPLLQDKDVVCLKRIMFRRVKVNDIITARKFNKLLTHRVIYKKNNYVITKGDNNLKSDGKIYPRQILGRMYQIKRDGQVINPENLYLIQSSLYFAEIVKIKKVLEKEKINFVFLKGLPLYLYFEKSHPRRIYADCDILVNKKSYSQVQEILAGYGYKGEDHSISFLHRALRNPPTEISFHKKTDNFYVTIDIHLEVTPLFNQFGNLDSLYPANLIKHLTGSCLRNKVGVEIENEKFNILRQEYMIIFLAIHAFRHNFKGVYRLEFLHELILKNKPDWKNIANLILYFELQNFAYPEFLLLKKFFATPIPKSFFTSLKIDFAKMSYIRKFIVNKNIFDGEIRSEAGTIRFRNLFYLSPSPFWKKIFVFANPAVLYSIFWVFFKKIRQ